MHRNYAPRSAGLIFTLAIFVSGGFVVALSQFVCPSFPSRHSAIVELFPNSNVREAIYFASPGTTFLLNTGTYRISSTIHIRADNITIRSKTGNRDDVILDGNSGKTPLLPANFVNVVIAVSASCATIADLTIRYARWHGIHAYAPANRGIDSLWIHNIHIYDCGQQLIKVNSNGLEPPSWVDRGIIECSLIEFIDNSVMEPMSGGYYTGGIDIHGGWDWIIRGNTFRNIQRNASCMEHAVHLWSKSRGTIVENNAFFDVYRAIGFGMKTEATTLERRYPDNAGDRPYFDHIGGMIRNNTIFNRAGIHLETGIELMNITGAEIYHNTVVSIDVPFNSMEYRWPNTRVTMKNNLCSHRIMARDGAQAQLAGNLADAPLSLFVNAPRGDLHLAPEAAAAINRGVVLPDGKSGVDIDGQTRDAAPDIGADEYAVGSNTVHLAKPQAQIRRFYHARVFSAQGKALTLQRSNPNGFAHRIIIFADNKSVRRPRAIFELSK